MKKSDPALRAVAVEISSKQDKMLAAWRSAALYLVLFKYSGIRFWPHVYAGEAFNPSRAQYYLESAVTLFAILTVIPHVNSLRTVAKADWASVAFSLIAVASSLAISSKIPGSTFYALGYCEILSVLSLCFFFDGSKTTTRIMVNSGTIFFGLNVLSLALPSQSFMIGEFSGAFRGLTAHRNDLAQVSSVYLLISLFAVSAANSSQRFVNIALAILMVGLARSAQGVILSLLGVAMLPFLRLPTRLRRIIFVASVAVAVIFVLTLIFIPDDVSDFFAIFGRDTSFTGRDRIWALSLYLISVMPVWGYGTGFVSSDNISIGLLAEYQLGTLFGSAHNAYLEAILTYGWFGAGMFFLIVAKALLRIKQVVWDCRDNGLYLSAVLLVYSLIGGITASEKLFLPNFGWLSFVFAMALYDSRTRERTFAQIFKPRSSGNDPVPAASKRDAGRHSQERSVLN